MKSPGFLSNMLATAVLGISISVMSAPVFADGGIRVHRAAQFHNLKKRLNEKDNKAEYFHRTHDLNKRRRHYSRQAPVPDSRFPNSYLEYSRYLQQRSFYGRER